jgi:autotransporter-associated beta strand protein
MKITRVVDAVRILSRNPLPHSLSVVAAMALAAAPALAQSVWTGQTSSDYGDGSNWSAGAATGGVAGRFDDSVTGFTLVDLGAATFAPGDISIIGNTAFTIENGTLTLGAGTRLTSDSSVAQTVSALITGAGGVTQNGTGTLTLSGANTYTGTTTINAGTTLQVGNGGASGTLGNGTITNNGALIVNRSGTLVINGGLTGTAGSLSVTGGGTTVLAGSSNSYGGGTTIAAGNTLQFGNGGAYSNSSTGAGAIVNEGTLVVNRSSGTLTVAAPISGSGRVVMSGVGGGLTLTGVNTYTGGTTVNGGTVTVTSDANLGDVSGGLTLDGGALSATASFAIDRAVTLGAGGGTFSVASGQTLTVNGLISGAGDRKSTRLNSSHSTRSRMPSSA